MLNRVLPEGLKVLDVKPVFIKSPSISKIVSLLHYRIEPINISQEKMNELIEGEDIIVKRMKEDKEVEINIRPFIHSLKKHNDTVDIRIRSLPEGSVRIDEILSFFKVDRLGDMNIERIGMFAEKDGELIDPFDY